MPDISVHRMRERRVLDQVAEGETFTVTRRGKPVARLGPIVRAISAPQVAWTWGSDGLQAQGETGQTYIVPKTCKGTSEP